MTSGQPNDQETETVAPTTRLRIFGAADPPFRLETTTPPFSGIDAEPQATWFTV